MRDDTRESHIKDILIEYSPKDYSKYGLFPLFAWFLMDVIKLPLYLKPLEKYFPARKGKRTKQSGRPSEFTAVQMSMGIIASILLGIPRLGNIRDILSTESKMAQLFGLPRFFDQSTGHRFLNEFDSWKVKTLLSINQELLNDFGESVQQDFLVVDLDSQTHTLESRQRQKATRGYNKKNPGKPCYQWNVAFARNEVITQELASGNTRGLSFTKSILESIEACIGEMPIILRLDGGYWSGSLLDYLEENGIRLVTSANARKVLHQAQVTPGQWEQLEESEEEKTRLCDLGKVKVISTSERKFRVVLVETKQKPFPGKKKKAKLLQYAIVEDLPMRLSTEGVYRYYHKRQTIENAFKEGSQSLSSGKMPSQLFRANEAYLQYVAMAYNCYHWFQKFFFPIGGRPLLWKASGKKRPITEH